jgi:bifunctional enzyme CysN/CysC
MAPELLRFTTAGSVDDGKSTLIGRLLHDSSAVYEDQLESVRKASRDGLDLAFITDGLRAEREQGITIDVAYRYFSTPRRRFIIADTPGHEQYTRNMATGASTAQLAVVLLDARKGVVSQTRRHAYIAWLLGIRQIVAAVNKMDLVGYSQAVFDDIRAQVEQIAVRLPGCVFHVIPVSALEGDNIVRRSRRMPWFADRSLLEYLEEVAVDTIPHTAQLRLPVQYVIRSYPDFRGYAGQIASGSVGVGDELMILPSGQATRVRSICMYDGNIDRAFAPMSVTVCLEDHFDVSRSDMLASPQEMPVVGRHWRASLVWMSEAPLALQRPYLVKHTSRRVCAQVTRLMSRVDLNTLEQQSTPELCLNDIGTVEFETHQPLFCDAYERNRTTGSFILIDPITNQTLAAGMIIGPVDRGEGDCRLSQNVSTSSGLTLWFTGLSSAGKTTLSRAVYERLWAMGAKVESLDGDVVRQHLCNDLGFSKQDRDENIRRIGFVADLLTHNGVIVLVSAISPYRAARDDVRRKIGAFVEIYVNAPLAICEQRDVKGLYKKARSGKLPGFTGIDDPYEPPLAPEIECRTDQETLAESTEKVVQYVRAHFSPLR